MSLCEGNLPVNDDFPFIISLTLAWINVHGWRNRRVAGVLRCHDAHFNVSACAHFQKGIALFARKCGLTDLTNYNQCLLWSWLVGISFPSSLAVLIEFYSMLWLPLLSPELIMSRYSMIIYKAMLNTTRYLQIGNTDKPVNLHLTPQYFALVGELWGVCCAYFGETECFITDVMK